MLGNQVTVFLRRTPNAIQRKTHAARTKTLGDHLWRSKLRKIAIHAMHSIIVQILGLIRTSLILGIFQLKLYKLQNL